MTAIAVFVLLSFVMASTAFAQVSAASINGTARDASGASIPSAAIVAHNIETNIDTRTTTNEQGVYVILHLLPGSYTIEASKEGFARPPSWPDHARSEPVWSRARKAWRSGARGGCEGEVHGEHGADAQTSSAHDFRVLLRRQLH